MRLPSVLLACGMLLTVACEPPGSTSSSSSSGGSSSSSGMGSSGMGSSSSAASGSSSGAAVSHNSRSVEPDVATPAVGQALPLEELCNVLAQGVLKQTALNGAGAAAMIQRDCAPLFSNEEERLQAEFGRMNAARAEYCDPDAGTIAALAVTISQSQAAGRALYHGDKAAQCVTVGRSAFPFVQGIWRTDAGVGFDAGACGEVLEGLVALGNVCQADFECAPGAYCQRDVSSQDCAGVCATRLPQGVECSAERGRCQDGLECLRLADAGQRCGVPPGLGDPCLPSAYSGGGCPSPWLCSDAGACGNRPPSGQPCDPSVVPYCAPEAYCESTSRMCRTRIAEGEACTGTNCQPCLECYRPRVPSGTDGGPSRCRAFVGVDQDCTYAPCHAGLLCVNGSCHALNGTDEPCQQVSGDSTWRGTCRRSSDVCIGTPTTCHPRDLEAWPCESDRVGSQGTCEEALFCSQPGGPQTAGVCKRLPALGEVCGSRPDLSSSCRNTLYGPYVACGRAPNAPVGVCVLNNDAPTGAACTSTYACTAQDFCMPGLPGELGTCQPAPGLSSPCGTGVAWSTHCSQGFCQGSDAGATCSPLLTLGAQCDPTETGCTTDGQCRASPSGGHTCQPRIAVGSPCDAATLCAEGLECVDFVCSVPQCAAPVTNSNCVEVAVPTFLIWGVVLTGGFQRRRRSRRPRALSR